MLDLNPVIGHTYADLVIIPVSAANSVQFQLPTAC
jgi:hypothetical protein